MRSFSLPAILALLALLVPAFSQQSDEGRFDMVQDSPEWHEVDPDLLYFREFEVSCTYAPGYTELPKTFKISLEPSGYVKILTPRKTRRVFGGMWFPNTSVLKRTTTGFSILFRRWKPEQEQDMEYLIYRCNFKSPVFQPNSISLKEGEVVDENGRTVGRFTARMPHNRVMFDSNFKAYRSWLKQGFW